MAWTKRQIIDLAYEEIGVPSPSARMRVSGLLRLDGLAAQMEQDGARFGYAFPSGPDESGVDDSMDIPDQAAHALYLGLAVRVASTIGKTALPSTMTAAQKAMRTLIGVQEPPAWQRPKSLPRGSGNKPYRHSREYFDGIRDDPEQDNTIPAQNYDGP